MAERYVEIHRAPGTRINQHIATHLHVRYPAGKVVIITDQPEQMLAVIRKYWMQAVRLLLLERAATLNKQLIDELSTQLAMVGSLRFGVAARLHGAWADVTLMQPEEFTSFPPDCRTVYLCIDASRCEQYISQMPAGCIAIVYDTS